MHFKPQSVTFVPRSGRREILLGPEIELFASQIKPFPGNLCQSNAWKASKPPKKYFIQQKSI